MSKLRAEFNSYFVVFNPPAGLVKNPRSDKNIKHNHALRRRNTKKKARNLFRLIARADLHTHVSDVKLADSFVVVTCTDKAIQRIASLPSVTRAFRFSGQKNILTIEVLRPKIK